MSLYNPQYKDEQGNVVDLPINAKKLDGYSYNDYSKYYTTSSTTANAFLVTIPYVKELSDGLVIHCQFHTATKSGATLDVNNLGAKGIYYRYATAITTQIVANNYVDLIYSASIDKWVLLFSYDSNSNSLGYQVRTNNGSYYNSASTSCYRYQILVETTGGLEAFTSTSNSTGTGKTQLSPKYIPNGTIRYYSGTSTIASKGKFSATALWQQYQGINLKYSFNISTITTDSPCYIKMSRNTDGTLSPVYSATSGGHPLVFALPTTKDGYYYTYLGRTYTSSSVVYLELELSNPTFYYDGGVRVYDGTYFYDWAKASTKPTYTASEVGALPDTTTIPTKTSELTNDSGYITGINSSMVTTALGYTPTKSIKAVAGSNINSVGTPQVSASSDSSNNVTLTFNYLKGATGPQGPKGDKGDIGPQGPKGDNGSDATVTASAITSALGYTPGKVTTVNDTSPNSSGNVYLNFLKSGDYKASIPYLTSNATIALTTDIPVTKYTQSTVNLYSLKDGRYINSTEDDITMYYRSSDACSRKWKPGDILYIKFHRFYLLTQGIDSLCMTYGVADNSSNSAWYSNMDLVDIPQVYGQSMKEFGNESTPVYLSRDNNFGPFRFKECKLYGGGTGIMKINGYDTLGKTYDSLFAPETAGEADQFLKSNGYGAPTWETVTIPTKSSWNYDDVYVKYNASQSLTDAQKSQARSNIGAGTSSLSIGTTSSTAAAGNHTHSTTLTTDSGAATVTMAPNTTYKLSTGGTNIVFKTPSDAYKIKESLNKSSEADTAVGYYKIATINHASWNFCDFCMLVKESYSGTVYSTIFNCSCSDSNVTLRDFKLNIISGTNISNKLAYLYTYDSSNNVIKVEVFIHTTRFEHPAVYIINTRPGQQLVIPTQDDFNKATPDKPDGTTMTGYATYAPVSGGTNGQLLSTNGSSLVWTNDNRSLLHHDLAKTIENTTTDNGWKMFNDTYDGFLLKSLRFQSHSPAWGVGDFGSGIVFGGADTKGVMSVSYGKPQIKFAGGNGTGPKWWVGLTGTSGTSYDLDRLKYAPTTAGTSGYSLKSNGSGAPRWANEAAVQINGSLTAGVKNNDSITLVITNTSKPLKKGVWRYSGTYGTFLIFAQNEIPIPGSPRTAYICGYTTEIPYNTSFTLVEV